MSFDLFISRAATFGKIKGGGLFSRTKPITNDEFQALMQVANPIIRPDGSYWLRHPNDNTPWFAARLAPEGCIVLSVSYTNHQYLRNVLDAFDAGLRMASAIGANLFEEVRQLKIDESSIDDLLDPDGDYVGLQRATFEHVLSKMDSEGGAGLEYPLSDGEFTPEYFVFHITLPDGFNGTLPKLLSPLKLPGKFLKLEDNVACLAGEDGRIITKVLLRDDGTVQIWPVHGLHPFAEAAKDTFRVAMAIRQHYCTKATFNFREIDPQLESEIAQRCDGLGIEMLEWVASWSDDETGNAH